MKTLFNPSVKQYSFLLGFHIVLGIVSTFSNLPLILWFYLVLGTFFIKLMNEQADSLDIIKTMTYLISMDVLSRMAKCTPFIPFEVSKYLGMLFLLIGILKSKNSSIKGVLMLLLIIPSIFYDFSGEVGFADVVNNAFGMINLALGIMLFQNTKLQTSEVRNILGLMLLTTTMVLTFAFVKTPDFDDLDLTLNAQFKTSGDFGSNQVSTILGLGAFIILSSFVMEWRLTISKIADLVLVALFLIQGLLTFSRGGVLSAVTGLSVMMFFLILRLGLTERIGNIISKSIISIVFGLILFNYVNSITGNKLINRYKGETEGTFAGTREADLNLATSGRYDILVGDYELWLEFPITGVGIGASKYMRELNENAAAHIELSRLLAEQGIAGILIFIIWLSLVYNILKNNNSPRMKALMLAIYTLALLTSFHAAMRTFLTPLLTGLSLVKVNED